MGVSTEVTETAGQDQPWRRQEHGKNMSISVPPCLRVDLVPCPPSPSATPFQDIIPFPDL